MQKEEIFAIIDQLIIDQESFNTFKEYTTTFIKDKRCRKGAIAFIEEVFKLPQVAGKEELALELVSEKCYQNSIKTEQFIFNHPITLGYSEALKQARLEVMSKIAEYIIDISQRLTDSELLDKNERQVYLRRAVARLVRVLWRGTQVIITADQWPEVTPDDRTEYLTETLEELTLRISDPIKLKEWSDVYGSHYRLDDEKQLRSVRNFLNYLETFLEE